MRDLLQKVTEGDDIARNLLCQNLMADKRVGKTINALTYRNSVVEADDVKGEFWRGVAMGFSTIRHDIGDPILHLIQRGIWQVKSTVRQELQKRIIQLCGECGRFNKKYAFTRRCTHCNGSVENVHRETSFQGVDIADIYLDRISTLSSVGVTGRISQAQRRIIRNLVEQINEGVRFPALATAKALGISKQRVHQQIKILRSYVELTERQN